MYTKIGGHDRQNHAGYHFGVAYLSSQGRVKVAEKAALPPAVRKGFERVKKLKMANCRSFIFNGLEHAQSPVFEFFHTFFAFPRASARLTPSARLEG